MEIRADIDINKVCAMFWIADHLNNGTLTARMLCEEHDDNFNNTGNLFCYEEVYRIRDIEIPEWMATNREKPYLGYGKTEPVYPAVNLEADTILASQACKGHVGPPPEISLYNSQVVASVTDMKEAKEAGKKILAQRSPLNFHYFISHSSIEHDIDADIARAQPDDALVACWIDDGGNNHGVLLGNTGAYLFYQTYAVGNDIEEIGLNPGADDLGPGIWVLRNMKSWATVPDGWGGDYDSGIDGEAQPATLEDLKSFGFNSEQAVRDELDSGWEVHFRTDILLHDAMKEPALYPGELKQPDVNDLGGPKR